MSSRRLTASTVREEASAFRPFLSLIYLCFIVCIEVDLKTSGFLFSGDDERKDNDGESVASVGEEYEPISDDELDEILADSQKKEDQQDEEKITGTKKTGVLFFFREILEMSLFLRIRCIASVTSNIMLTCDNCMFSCFLLLPVFINHKGYICTSWLCQSYLFLLLDVNGFKTLMYSYE